MYELIESEDEIGDIDSWLSFEDKEGFEPIEDGWVVIHRTGHKTTEISDGMVVDQGFRVHCGLVKNENVDSFSSTDPFGKVPEFDFRPRYEGDLTREVGGTEIEPFVVDFRKEAPLIDSGFVEYHDLIETEKRNFETYDTEETVVRFPSEKWEELKSHTGSYWELDDTILSLEVRAEYLKDYLEEKGCSLILAYFQSRDLESSEEGLSMPEDNRDTFQIQGGKAVRSDRAREGYELHWFCPIRSSDISFGYQESLLEKRQSLKFRTKQGYRFTKQEVIEEEGFEEAGYRRPAIGADDIQEALGFFGWTFFDPEVLDRYRRSSKGSVSEWSEQGMTIGWMDKMSLRAYWNEEDLVTIIIDDLEKIPDEELPHWHQHNTSPEGDIPEEMITNYIEADFVGTESPAQAVINAITETNEAFNREYQAPLYKKTEEEIDVESISTIPREERHELLDTMANAHQIVVENLRIDSLKSEIPEDSMDNIEGKKSALYEFVNMVSDTKTAVEVLEPINTIHDLRTEESHMEINNGGWSRAMETLEYDENTDAYTEIYREVLNDTASSIREIGHLIEEET
jgi:hypothetical protein